MRDFNGFVKVGMDLYGGVKYVNLWHPKTHECKSVACEDTEYWDDDMGLVDRSYTCIERHKILGLPWYGGENEVEEAYEAWKRKEDFKAGRIRKGFTVEVFKGRKFPIGTRGVVKEFSDFKDKYGRVQSTYIVTEDGKRIPMHNCKVVSM